MRSALASAAHIGNAGLILAADLSFDPLWAY
jgi:hypothetical protein